MFLLAVIIFIFIGQENFQDFMSWLIPNFKPFTPVSGLLSIAFGGFLIYSFSKNKQLEHK